MKYSDFANDSVLFDILSFLLLTDSKKVPFLNNANMDNIGGNLKRLIQDIEKEMDEVRKERENLQNSWGPNGMKVDINPERYFSNMVKRSRFQKTLQINHRHKLSMPDLHAVKPAQETKLRSQRYFLQREDKLARRKRQTSQEDSAKEQKADPMDADVEDSVSVSELQLNANYAALAVLRNLVDALERNEVKTNAELFAMLRQLHDQHCGEVSSILKRKLTMDNI